jgi:Zn-dependent protease with chaperone function
VVPTGPARERVISDTSLRFAQLILLLVASSIAMINAVANILSGTGGRGCYLAAGLDLENYSPAELARVISMNGQALDACLAKYAGEDPVWVGWAWAVLLLVCTVVLFFGIPRWRTRGSRSTSLADVDRDGGIDAELTELARRAGLERAPRVVVDPFAYSTTACVFGRTRSPVLRIHGGLLAGRHKDRERFQSVVLHEFAHVRNRDITTTYAVVAMWRVFVVLVLLPFIGAHVYSAVVAVDRFAWAEASMQSAAVDIAASAVMAILVYLARSDILRAREHHADLTASEHGAHQRAWSGPETTTGARRGPRAVADFRSLWHIHPTWEMRRAVLNDPSLLNRPQKLPLALTGLAAVLVWHQTALTARSAVSLPLVADLASMLIPAVVLTLALWRFIGDGGVGHRGMPVGMYAGLWTGVGMVAAIPLVSTRFAFGELPTHPELLVVLVLMVIGLGWWISQTAHLTITRRGGRRPWLRLVVLAGGTWFALAAIWGLWQQIELFMAGSVFDFESLQTYWANWADDGGLGAASLGTQVLVTWSIPLVVVDVPVLFTALTLLWVIPMLALAGRPSADGATRSLRPALLPAVTAGAAAAAVGWLYAPDLAGLPLSRSIDDGNGTWFVLFLHWQAMLTVLAAAVAATVAAARTRDHRLVYALIAGQVAMLVSATAGFAIDVGSNCLPGTADRSCASAGDTIWGGFRVTFSVVPLATTVLTVVAAFVVSAWFRIRPRMSPGPRPGSAIRISRPKALARSWIVATGCLLALALAAWQGVVDLRTGQAEGSAAASTSVFVTAAYEPSPQMRQAQVNEWLNEGGADLATSLYEALKRLRAVVEALPDDPHVIARLSGICTDFSETVDDARAYFRFPEQSGQHIWQTLLATVATGAQRCATAYESKNAESLGTAVNTLNGIDDPLLTFSEHSLAMSGG